VIDPNIPEYQRWRDAARSANSARWDAATPEEREQWIAKAQQKELDDAKRVSPIRASAGKFGKMKPGVIPPVVGEPAVPSDGMGRPKR
jgi:hypothetical protein